jgi:hypothetical protein
LKRMLLARTFQGDSSSIFDDQCYSELLSFLHDLKFHQR